MLQSQMQMQPVKQKNRPHDSLFCVALTPFPFQPLDIPNSMLLPGKEVLTGEVGAFRAKLNSPLVYTRKGKTVVLTVTAAEALVIPVIRAAAVIKAAHAD